VLNSLPEEVQQLIRNWHERGWTPMGRLGTPEDIGNVATLLFREGAVNYGPGDLRGRRRVPDEPGSADRNSNCLKSVPLYKSSE